MKIVRYHVRSKNKAGEPVKRKFKVESKALDTASRWLRWGRRVVVFKTAKESFHIIGNGEWEISEHKDWTLGPRPLAQVFIHTSVTKQLRPGATKRAEMRQMRAVDGIAHARGFNGFSYSYGVFPSGRVYEGRAFGIVEAATADFNTSSDSICLIGNTDVFDPTPEQERAIVDLIGWGQDHGFLAHKGLDVRGHREVAAKACPGAKFTDNHIASIQRKVRLGT